MSQSDEALQAALDAMYELTKVSASDLRYAMECRAAWKQLAIRQLGFSEGDRVAIRDGFTCPMDSGWARHHEWMRPGQTGVVQEIGIDPRDLHVWALTMFDTEWTVSTWDGKTHRYNSMMDHDGVTPKDRRHVFYFAAKHLRPATEDDAPFSMPAPIPVGAS